MILAHGGSHSAAQYTVSHENRDTITFPMMIVCGCTGISCTRVGEIYVKINLKRCMNTTISGSLYSTPPLLPFYRSANKNDVSPENLKISMLSQCWRNNNNKLIFFSSWEKIIARIELLWITVFSFLFIRCCMYYYKFQRVIFFRKVIIRIWKWEENLQRLL